MLKPLKRGLRSFLSCSYYWVYAQEGTTDTRNMSEENCTVVAPGQDNLRVLGVTGGVRIQTISDSDIPEDGYDI